MVGEVAKSISSRELRLPSDIDQYAFTKFTSVYFKAHIWGMKRDPIKSPFLAKSNETDYQSSLAIFKLVSRFSPLHPILQNYLYFINTVFFYSVTLLNVQIGQINACDSCHSFLFCTE